jgi:hypothetical protein
MTMLRLLALLTVVLCTSCVEEPASEVQEPPQPTRPLVDTSITELAASRLLARCATSAQRKIVWEDRLQGQRVRWPAIVHRVVPLGDDYVAELICDEYIQGELRAPNTLLRVEQFWVDTQCFIDRSTAASLAPRQIITIEGTLTDYINRRKNAYPHWTLVDGEVVY